MKMELVFNPYERDSGSTPPEDRNTIVLGHEAPIQSKGGYVWLVILITLHRIKNYSNMMLV
jgi:hypothetical protein